MNAKLFVQIAEGALADGLFQDCSWRVFTREGICAGGHVGPSPENAVYDLASLTKTFTTTAALALCRERGLSLDEPLSGLPGGLLRELPAGTVAAERLAALTLRRLMTHTSGLQAWYPFYADGRPFWQILAERLEATPQTGMVYSDLNYILMREILCHITGLSFPQVIERYVREPLRLPQLGFAPLPEALPVAPCCRDNQIEERMCQERGVSFEGFRPHGQAVYGQTNDGNAYYYFKGVSGHAGLFTDADSVAQFGRFYLQGDEWFAQALQPQPGCEGRCIGFHTGEPFPTGCGHTGFTGTSLWLDAERGIGMAILANRLMSATCESPNLMPFRMEMHRAALDM